jgi:putative endonuclease
MKQYFVYINTNKSNKVFYTGFTDDLVKRAWQHKNKLVDGFTKKYNVDKLVYFEIYDHPTTGITGEKTVKNMVRKKKIGLIESMNPDYKDLYDDLV